MHFCRKPVCFATTGNFGSQKIATEAAAAVNAKTTTHSIAIKLNSTFKVILEDTKSKVESGRRLHQIHKAIYVFGSISKTALLEIVNVCHKKIHITVLLALCYKDSADKHSAKITVLFQGFPGFKYLEPDCLAMPK